MITTTRKLGIAAFLIWCLFGAHGPSGYASGDTTESQAGSTVTRIKWRHSDGPDRQGSDDDKNRERHHFYGPEVFHQFIKAELEHLPALNSRMDRLTTIQEERRELQKQRQAVASKPGTDKTATIENFHSLLRRDFALSDEARKIAQEIVKDLPEIQKQIQQRRQALQTELDKANTTADSDGTSSSASRDIRRKLRYVEFLDKKLDDLKVHPERIDLLTRMLRGVPFDDGFRDGWRDDEPRTPQEHLEDLKQKRKALQRELRQVENEMDLIKEKGAKDEQSTSPGETP